MQDIALILTCLSIGIVLRCWAGPSSRIHNSMARMPIFHSLQPLPYPVSKTWSEFLVVANIIFLQPRILLFSFTLLVEMMTRFVRYAIK